MLKVWEPMDRKVTAVYTINLKILKYQPKKVKRIAIYREPNCL